MKLTSKQLKRIIKEELNKIVENSEQRQVTQLEEILSIEDGEYYAIPGEHLIEFRKMANQLSALEGKKIEVGALKPMVEYMRTLTGNREVFKINLNDLKD